eukprot:scaffold2004_cov107-Isochrysis_galbana.AAC.10
MAQSDSSRTPSWQCARIAPWRSLIGDQAELAHDTRVDVFIGGTDPHGDASNLEHVLLALLRTHGHLQLATDVRTLACLDVTLVLERFIDRPGGKAVRQAYGRRPRAC